MIKKPNYVKMAPSCVCKGIPANFDDRKEKKNKKSFSGRAGTAGVIRQDAEKRRVFFGECPA